MEEYVKLADVLRVVDQSSREAIIGGGVPRLKVTEGSYIEFKDLEETMNRRLQNGCGGLIKRMMDEGYLKVKKYGGSY